MGSNLDGLMHYLSIWRSERSTADIPPDRSGYETADTMTEPIDENEVPVSYEEAVSRKDIIT